MGRTLHHVPGTSTVSTTSSGSRRWFLGIAAALGAGSALAACGGSAATPSGTDPAAGTTAPAGESPMAPSAASGPDVPINPAALPGRLVFVGDSDVRIWEKGTTKRIVDDRISRQPSWSPDGKKIAFVKLGVNSSEIWTMDADGANSRQLTHNDTSVLTNNNWAFRPVWWPDGSKLLYLTEETTNDLMLWQLTLDGKSHRPFLSVPDMDGGLDMPSLTADAKRLAVVSYRGPGVRSQVWTYGLPSGPWRQLTDTAEGAYDPAWSPDGTRIAYVVRNKGRHDVWVMAADGDSELQVTQNGASRAPCWSPDGQYLAYCSAGSGVFDLWVTAAPPLAPAPPAATSGPATGSPPARATELKLPSPKQLTRGAVVDAVSGLSWTR